MSFKVGDEVYLKAKIIKVDQAEPKYKVVPECDPEHAGWFSTHNLIPAHRVTVAKARRKAEFPKDWGKLAWFSDDQSKWHKGTIVGHMEDHTYAWIAEEKGGCVHHYTFCEVDE